MSIIFKKQIMKNFGLDTQIMGLDPMSYIAGLIEKNEKNEIDLERMKQSVAGLKQFNNHARLRLDAAKYELKAKEFELEQLKQNKAES